MRLLLQPHPAIQLYQASTQNLYLFALPREPDVLLKHDPEMPVPEQMFFKIFSERPSKNEQNRSRLVQLLQIV